MNTQKLFTIFLATLLLFTFHAVPKPLVHDGLSSIKEVEAKRKRKRRVRRFALNFNNVDIHVFLNMMSKLIGKNIIADDKVRGKITISSARRVPVHQAYEIMKSILEIKGLAVIETKNLIKVVPIRDAVKQNVEIWVDGKKTKTYSKKSKIITYLFEVKFSEANDIANTLKPLKSKSTNIVVYRPMNTIILSGSSNEIKGLIAIARALDKPEKGKETRTRSAGNIHVVHLENANAEQLAAVLSRVPFSATAKINNSPIRKTKVRRSRKARRKTSSQTSKRSKMKLSIIPNKDTNSLIITATRKEYDNILSIIKQLDIVREQVLIEALIIEVGATNGWGLGVDWMLGYQVPGSNHIVGGSNIGTGGIPNFAASTLSGTSALTSLTTGFQIGYLYNSSVLGYALLHASSTDTKFNILSTPQILTIDNHEAEINVGKDIAVPSQGRTSETGVTTQTYEYKSVGVKLKITPHITKNKVITLDLYQEVNEVIGDQNVQSGSLIPPTLTRRDIKTKISVRDGKTIVVGGLISNKKTVTETKVPILGDIPVLGWLFKRKDVSYEKNNLLIFITPHIVTKQKKLDAITKRKRRSQLRMDNK